MADIQLSGSVGSGGSFAILGKADVVIVGNANLVLSLAQYSNYFVRVTSDGASLAVRTVQVPLNEGTTFWVQNATNEGFAILVAGPSGTGVSIPPGATALVATDGTNYFSPTNGALKTWKTTTVTNGLSPYTPAAGEAWIPCNTSGGAVVINTPANPVDGQDFSVKPVVASATPITVTAVGGATIENPSNACSFGASGAVPGQGGAVTWKYKASTTQWIGASGF